LPTNDDVEAGDGCYRCLYTRESIDDLATLSKRATIDQLVDLLSRMNLTSVKTLSDVATAKLADSELELLFLARFIDHAKAQGFTHSQAVEAGWAVHTFRRGKERLVLRPQVDVGPKEGVAVPSRPDFVLETRVDARGERVERRPIAIFCDGFAFHAQLQDGSSRLIDDVRKRSAILQSERYRVWSITWEDLARSDLEKPLLPILPAHGNEGAFDQMAKQLQQLDLVGLLGRGSLHQLFRLAQCDDDAWGALAGALWSSISTKPPKQVDELGWALVSASALPAIVAGGSGDLVLATSSWPHVGVAVAASMKALSTTFKKAPAEALRMVVGLDDGPEARAAIDEVSGKRPFAAAWQRFLLWANLLQGAGQGSLRTVAADAAGVVGTTSVTPSTSTSAAWVSDVDPRLAPLAARFADADLPTPAVLADLGPAVGAGWGQAELAWLDARVAVLHPEADFAVDDARAAGWLVVVAVANLDISSCVDRIRSSP